jgi:LuxR family maltose regulon positive regulatory protein
MIELLRTKLFIPRPRKNLVVRPRLVNCLNAGLDKKLTLIAAPAGFGKTTLLSEWIPQSPRCVTWLSLDESDNDLSRFWTYFIASLQSLSPQLGDHALALLQSSTGPEITSILTVLINEITAFEEMFVIVLDDYHVIQENLIHETLNFLIDHLPDSLHLAITSRVDPPLQVSRLRVRDQLTEIRANELRFTTGEAAAFLSQVMGLNLSAEEAALLETRTEGWIAGLQIAALSMQGRNDKTGFIQAFSGSHRHILGYLADEVINQQSEGTLKFVLQTSILDRLCGPLCEAVTGDPGGQETLQGLERANLFIIPLDNEGVWYRYHHLFGEVLRNRLTASSIKGETNTAALHRRASGWFEEAGLIDDAIHHALAASDLERAAVLVERYSVIMMQQSNVFLFRSWLQQLPEELVQTRPRLILAYGWSLVLTGHVKSLEQWLEAPNARKALTSPDPPMEVLGELTLLRATLARFQRQADRSLELAQASLSQLAQDERGLLAGAMYTIGVAHLQKGDINSASQAFVEAATLGEAKGGPYMALSALDTLSDIQIRQGYLTQALQSCRQALAMAARWKWETMPAIGMIYIHLGRVLYEQNDLEGAARALVNGVDRLRGSIEQFLLAQGYVMLAQVSLARGHADEAFATIRQGEEWFSQMQVADTGAGTLLNLGKVRMAIRVNDLDTAIRWAEDCQWLPEHTSLGQVQAVTRVRLLLAQSRRGKQDRFLLESAATIDRLMEHATTGQWRGELIELLILRALLYRTQNNSTEMFKSLDQAIALAEPEGYIRVFADEGEPMRLLLLDYQSNIKRHVRDNEEVSWLRRLAYADKLLAALSPSAPGEEAANENLAEPLSQRELDILRLIAAGRSNQEIADTLVIAVSTVKSHINNLYGKLGTNRRTEAIAIARELGLLAE